MKARFNKLLCFFVAVVHVFCAIKLCKNEIDYYIPFSANCWDNPADRLSVAEILKNLFGFSTEEHFVTTKDGYILSLVRFYWTITKKNPVILGHGTSVNSFMFLAHMENSLAYILGTEGYDGWLINFRGTKYSREHKIFTVDDDRFWDFSFHELGVFDLSAIADYVYEKTNTKALYIGASTGGTAFTTYASVKPSEAKNRLLGAVLMAPAVKFPNQNSTLLYFDTTVSNLPYIFPRYHHGAIGYDSTFRDAILRVITISPITMRIFNAAMALSDGYHPQSIDWSHYPLMIIGMLDVSTKKIMNHFGQSVRSGEFRYFDYGEENQNKYKQGKPPLYPLENIEVPTAILVGQGDLVTPIAGAMELYKELPIIIKCGFHTVKDPSYSHTDSAISLNARENMFEPVMEFLRKMESGTCCQS